MAFRQNDIRLHQTSLFNDYLALSDKKKELLRESWAEAFRNDIIPNINEDLFRPLFDEEGSASRPNSPINVLVGASILQVMYGFSEKELMQNIAFDFRFSYALCLDSMNEDAFSDRTLRRFHKRVADYCETTGIDLIKQTMEDMSDELASIMGIDQTKRRMDSFMIDMTAKRMGRRELVYEANKGLVQYLFFIGDTEGIMHLQHYTESEDHNRILYNVPEEYVKYRDGALLNDASLLMQKCEDTYRDEKAFAVFARVIQEQTVLAEDGTRRFRTKEDGGMSSSMMQGISDPDATYRFKAGESHYGYIANIEESVGAESSLITGYAFEPNNVSDQQMLRDRVEELPPQEKHTVIVADGGYDDDVAKEKAAEKNIEIITTDLLGQDTDPVYGGFRFNEEGTEMEYCPRGNTPIETRYDEKSGKCTGTFTADQCDECPYRNTCKPSGKRGDKRKVKASKKMAERARQQAEMAKSSFKEYGMFRNGVETIPSYFRTVLNVDRMYAYNKIRNAMYFGIRVMAYNVMKVTGFRKKQREKSALNVLYEA